MRWTNDDSAERLASSRFVRKGLIVSDGFSRFPQLRLSGDLQVRARWRRPVRERVCIPLPRKRDGGGHPVPGQRQLRRSRRHRREASSRGYANLRLPRDVFANHHRWAPSRN